MSHRDLPKLVKWLTANGVSVDLVPFHCEPYVHDDRIWYESYEWAGDKTIARHADGTAYITTKWVFHSVRIEDI